MKEQSWMSTKQIVGRECIIMRPESVSKMAQVHMKPGDMALV